MGKEAPQKIRECGREQTPPIWRHRPGCASSPTPVMKRITSRTPTEKDAAVSPENMENIRTVKVKGDATARLVCDHPPNKRPDRHPPHGRRG